MDTNFLYGGNWATFFIAAIIVSFASIFLSYIIDTVGKRTKFSGSLFAGTIVALISSLPELTMSLVNIFTDQKEGYALALGNLMGGNIFRTMIFAALSLLFIYSMRKAKTTFAQFFLVTIQIILTIGFLFNYMFYDKYTSE
jgi:cation:H+ antiporter